MKRILMAGVLAAAALVLTTSYSPASASEWNAGEALRSYVLANYHWRDAEVHNVRLSAEAPAEAPSRISQETPPPGVATFVLYFKHSAEIRATAEVRAFETVIIPRYPMRKGHLIEQDEVYLSSADVSKLQPGTMHDMGQVVGMPLSRPIGAGRPLTEDMIAPPSNEMRKRGCKVDIVAITDGLKITAAGTLWEDARIGSPVKVKNASSDRVVTGILVDENTVKVVY